MIENYSSSSLKASFMLAANTSVLQLSPCKSPVLRLPVYLFILDCNIYTMYLMIVYDAPILLKPFTIDSYGIELYAFVISKRRTGPSFANSSAFVTQISSAFESKQC